MEDVPQVEEEEQKPKSAIDKARERAAEVRRKKNLDTDPVVVVEQSDSDSEERLWQLYRRGHPSSTIQPAARVGPPLRATTQEG